MGTPLPRNNPGPADGSLHRGACPLPWAGPSLFPSVPRLPRRDHASYPSPPSGGRKGASSSSRASTRSRSAFQRSAPGARPERNAPAHTRCQLPCNDRGPWACNATAREARGGANSPQYGCQVSSQVARNQTATHATIHLIKASKTSMKSKSHGNAVLVKMKSSWSQKGVGWKRALNLNNPVELGER